MLKTTALKAQDVLVACKLYSLADVARPATDWTYASLSGELSISTGEIHNALERCRRAQLVVTVRDKEIVSKKHFCDLLVFAVPRIFYAVRGGVETGMPTGVHAPPLKGRFDHVLPEGVLPLVWAALKADRTETLVRGESISPLYPSAPEAASKDLLLYEVLALVDVVRVGDTRSRNAAVSILEKKILGKVSV